MEVRNIRNNGGEQTKCPKCATEMVKASLGPFAPLMNVVKEGDTFAERTGLGTILRGSGIKPYYCPNCGYLELYLEDPAKLSKE